MATIYYESDCDVNVLKTKKVAVIATAVRHATRST